MRQKRLIGFLGARVPKRVQEAVTATADAHELSIAELLRLYIEEGLKRDVVGV